MARGAKVECRCKNCGGPFTARVADRKRGWAKFCSKSCKAIDQTRRTGRGRPNDYSTPDRDGHTGNYARYCAEVHPFSSEAFEH